MFGCGQWHNLGKGWRARVDRPAHGGASKPHVHIENGSKKCRWNCFTWENIEWCRSPKGYTKKVRNLADYKKERKI